MAVEGRDIYIHRKGQRVGREINLLMGSEDGIRHYTAIKSLSRLLSGKNSNTKHKQHFCMNCLQGFMQESSRYQHQVYCEDNESVRVEMPKQGSTVEFKDGQNQSKAPFIMYTDFELILEPMDPVEPGSPNQPYTNEVNQHTPSGWCVYSKFSYGDVDNLLRTYRGKDCIETFCNYIKGEAHRLYHMFPELPMGLLTKKQWKRYKRSTKCHICYKPFTLRDLDHCHYTGLYRGPAHSLCNLRYKIPCYITVVFHNLSGYDTHLFTRCMIKIFRGGEGVVDGVGGSSERCLKWSGGGSLRDLSKNILNRGWVKAKVVRRGEGVLKVSPPLPPLENFNHTLGN